MTPSCRTQTTSELIKLEFFGYLLTTTLHTNWISSRRTALTSKYSRGKFVKSSGALYVRKFESNTRACSKIDSGLPDDCCKLISPQFIDLGKFVANCNASLPQDFKVAARLRGRLITGFMVALQRITYLLRKAWCKLILPLFLKYWASCQLHCDLYLSRSQFEAYFFSLRQIKQFFFSINECWWVYNF